MTSIGSPAQQCNCYYLEIIQGFVILVNLVYCVLFDISSFLLWWKESLNKLIQEEKNLASIGKQRSLTLNEKEFWNRVFSSLLWEGHGNPLQHSCLENPHGQRSMVSYSPWGCKVLGMTERLSTASLFYSMIYNMPHKEEDTQWLREYH